MSFFKDFKNDLSQAVNELIPEDDNSDIDFEEEKTSDIEEVDVSAELEKLDGLLKDVKMTTQSDAIKEKEMKEAFDNISLHSDNISSKELEDNESLELEFTKLDDKDILLDEELTEIEEEPIKEQVKEPIEEAVKQQIKEPIKQSSREPDKEEKKMSAVELFSTVKEDNIEEEEKSVSAEDNNNIEIENLQTMPQEGVEPIVEPMPEATDEVAIITNGTKITGNIESNGSAEIQGTITGNVTCNGKITVTGCIVGDSKSSEFFADAAKIEGEVISSGTVKIGLGSIVIGNITASSAVIAGAIKGDINVQGPVVVDTSAVIMGDIKSRSVQINNGAVIEGFCSQCYADIDVKSIFAEKEQ